PDGGRAGAAAGGRGGRARDARVVLRAARAGVPRAARYAPADPRGDGVRLAPDARGLLRDGGRVAPGDGRRRRGGEPADEGRRRGSRTRLLVLLSPGARDASGAVRVL